MVGLVDQYREIYIEWNIISKTFGRPLAHFASLDYSFIQATQEKKDGTERKKSFLKETRMKLTHQAPAKWVVNNFTNGVAQTFDVT